MYKKNRMRPSSEAIDMIIWREWMPTTVALHTVKSNPSSMDDPSENVLEYRLYWLSTSVVFTLKYILGLSIFVSGGSKERKNGAFKVVDVSIFSYFEKLSHTIQI